CFLVFFDKASQALAIKVMFSENLSHVSRLSDVGFLCLDPPYFVAALQEPIMKIVIIPCNQINVKSADRLEYFLFPEAGCDVDFIVPVRVSLHFPDLGPKTNRRIRSIVNDDCVVAEFLAALNRFVYNT